MGNRASAQMVFYKVTKERLLNHLDTNVMSLLKTGFHVHYRCTDPLVFEALLELVQADARFNQSRALYSSVQNHMYFGLSHFKASLLLTLGGEPPPAFIVVNAPSCKELFQNFGHFIYTTLKEVGFTHFVDIYDGWWVSQFKRIFFDAGFDSYLDALVKCCYLAGLKGNDVEARRYLLSVHNPNVSGSCVGMESEPLESKGWELLSPLFSKLLQQKIPPHTFLKVALSAYVVFRQGTSVSAASRLLGVSRSTMQQHLKMAQQIEFREFFDL